MLSLPARSLSLPAPPLTLSFSLSLLSIQMHRTICHRGVMKHQSNDQQNAAAGGAFGGTVLATYRGHSVPFYAASMGTNYGIASLVFFGKSRHLWAQYFCLFFKCI